MKTCLTCKHYKLDGSCPAFDKIPLSIISGEIPHDRLLEGQKGQTIWEPGINEFADGIADPE